MINVNPNLTVIGLSSDGTQMKGVLTAISDRQAVIDWLSLDSSDRKKRVTTLIVNNHDQNSTSLKVIAKEDGHYDFDQASVSSAQDLLHLIRKSQHLEICANYDVEHSRRATGFESVYLPVVALPERSWNDIVTETKFLDRIFGAPVLITGMTGGVAQGTLINERLAQAAADHNIPMGVGSQRLALENPKHSEIFQIKKKFPKTFLIGNIGIGQLQSPDFFDLCQRAVEMIAADALAIHINVLQELIQIEGDRNFRGLIEKIGTIKSKLGVPVIVKEVGSGLDTTTAKRLSEVGVKNFDVGGAGGTSWALIEGLRANDPLVKRRGEVFRNWGIPTARAIVDLREAMPTSSLIATGGIRDGLTVLKALHLGANMVGIGLPLMRAAIETPDGATKLLGAIIDELKIAKICSGL